MDKIAQSLTKKALLGIAKFLVFLAVMLFLPAGSLKFWQGWLFLFVFSASLLLITLYFLKRDPKLIERRLRAGPAAEKEKSQKRIQTFTSVCLVLMIVLPGLDRRFHWSAVPPALTVMGDLFVVLGFLIVFRVFQENRFTSGIVEVDRDQRVVSTGPYGIVRHPMYAGAVLIFLFMPLALGSFWALLLTPAMLIAIVVRLLEEEKFLMKNLPGYREYCWRVRCRLIPLVC